MLRKRMPKKAQSKFLVGLIMTLLAFFVILGIIKVFASEADVDSGMTICRGSIALREHSDLSVGKVTYKTAPLLCRTYHLDMPEKKYEKQDDAIEKNIADRIADCYWQFGEGAVSENVFNMNMWWGDDKCFVCFTFSIDDDKAYDKNVDVEELYDFMAQNPYTVSVPEKPFCGELEEEYKEKGLDPDTINPNDCMDEDDPECVRKGGYCLPYSTSLYEYDQWSCDRGNKCFVDQEKLVSYFDYIYYNKGEGAVVIEKDLAEFTPEQTYAIAFVSQTGDFGWKVVDIGSFFIPIPGVGQIAGKLATGVTKMVAKKVVSGGLTTLAKMEATAVRASMPKIAKFTADKGLNGLVRVESKILAAGESTAAKRIVQGTMITGTSEATHYTKDEMKEFFEGSPQIILVAPLSKVGEMCKVQKEVGQGS